MRGEAEVKGEGDTGERVKYLKAIWLIATNHPEFVAPIVIVLVGAAALAIREKTKRKQT